MPKDIHLTITKRIFSRHAFGNEYPVYTRDSLEGENEPTRPRVLGSTSIHTGHTYLQHS